MNRAERWGWLWLVGSVACGGSGGETVSATGTETGSVSGPTTPGEATQAGPTSTGGTTEALPTTGSPTTSIGESASVGTTTDSTSGTSEGTTAGATTGTGGTTTGTGEASTDGASSTTGAVSFCEGEGGIQLPGDEATCTGDLGKKTFLFAVCSCTGVTANNTLKTDSFDSEMGDMMPMDGGSVGVNGPYSASSMVDIGGSLWVDGKLETFNTHEVAQVLQCGADITATSASHVGADVFVEGDVHSQNKTMTIDGDLHIPPNKVNNGAVVLGATIKEAVSVETPCDCDDPIDIAGIVQYFAQNNDNAAQGLEPGELEALPQAKQLELPCGRYFFTGISSNNTLEISLTGRTVIAIEGAVLTAGEFDVKLGPEAELDLFIVGDADLNNAANIGDPKRPAATRIYAAGAVKFASGFTLGANLYQPNATFTANNTAEIWGSLFVGGLQLASPFTVHYDQAILELDGCEDPGSGCGDCHDCANPTPACKDGSCAPCEVDSDCCPPLVCDQGLCKAILPG